MPRVPPVITTFSGAVGAFQMRTVASRCAAAKMPPSTAPMVGATHDAAEEPAH